MSPLFVVVLVLAVGGAYLIGGELAGGLAISQENVLLQSSRTVAERTDALYTRQRDEAQRVAFTIGVPEAILNDNAEALDPLLRSLASVGDLDTIIVTDRNGREVTGVQVLDVDGETRYALSTDTDLSDEPIVRSVLDDAFIGATGLLRTPQGVMLFVAVPVNFGDEFVGIALVGQGLGDVLADVQGSAYADLAMYGGDQALLQTTFDSDINRSALAISNELYVQSATAVNAIPLIDLQLGDTLYQSAYQPFNYGPNTLGVIGTFVRDDVPFITEIGRQLVALFAATLAGGIVFITYIVMSRVAHRAERVKVTVEELMAGQHQARTQMQAKEEISAIGQAIDEYATQVDVEREIAKRQQEQLQKALRRQRRETAHILAVIESLPDGIVVQAMDGRVVMMNDEARTMLGSHRVFRSAGLHELTEVVSDQLGAALAPGLYALGDPRRIRLEERVLSGQAAAVLSETGRRLGTVVVIRDITDQVRREQEQEALLKRIASDIQQPLTGLARAGQRSSSDMVNAFAREVTRHTVALQKMIIELQDLANVDAVSIKRTQKPIHLETLIWALANEWRQVATANRLTLHVVIQTRDLYVLGDERRLRWAIGNILDNAVKYTPSNGGDGALTLEVLEESASIAHLRIRDNGVGIARGELPNVFTRFYRGTPVKPDGDVIRVPGMGQGLATAKQIIEAHGGTIMLKSTQGVGTAVYFDLPLTAPETLPITQFGADMEGDTVQLPADFLIELEK